MSRPTYDTLSFCHIGKSGNRSRTDGNSQALSFRPSSTALLVSSFIFNCACRIGCYWQIPSNFNLFYHISLPSQKLRKWAYKLAQVTTGSCMVVEGLSRYTSTRYRVTQAQICPIGKSPYARHPLPTSSGHLFHLHEVFVLLHIFIDPDLQSCPFTPPARQFRAVVHSSRMHARRYYPYYPLPQVVRQPAYASRYSRILCSVPKNPSGCPLSSNTLSQQILLTQVNRNAVKIACRRPR